MIIMGVDPGYARMGYGIVEWRHNGFRMLDYGCVETRSEEEMPDRLKALYAEISHVIDRFQPDVVAIEELFFNKNAKTAMLVAQGRGVAIVACANKNRPLYEYTPLQIKQALVGYGRADKSQVQYMVKLLLHLSETPRPDDAADALAVAICHGNSHRASDQMGIQTKV